MIPPPKKSHREAGWSGRLPRFVLSVAVLASLAVWIGCAMRTRDAASEVQDTVRAYFEAVNRADPTAIMGFFSRKAEATSVYEGDILRGWEQIRKENDKLAGTAGEEKWAPGTMEVTFLDEDHALVVVPINITLRSGGEKDELEGASTLVLEREKGRWKILHEHHSVKPSDSDEDYNSSRG
jgi:uncharacterized protein (TIGR02246 family)